LTRFESGSPLPQGPGVFRFAQKLAPAASGANLPGMKTILCSLLLAVLATVMVTSCNTVRGAGRDMQNVGSAVANMGR
jgi:predicted small secreted protein